jgi:hypothetical protein
VVFQAFEETLRIFLGQCASTDYHHVQATQQVLVPAKALTNEAFDAIAVHRSADLLTRDRQTKARRLAPTRASQHGERFAAGFLRMLEYALVVAGSQQTLVPLESRTRLRVWQVVQSGSSSGKAGSTFGAPGFDHFAARLCCHAGAKAVAPLALQSAWLKWSFHCAAPVAPTRKSLLIDDWQKGLNATVTFRCLSILYGIFRSYGLDQTTVIHSHPSLFSSIIACQEDRGGGVDAVE